jgi:hypothetical protein
MHQPRQQDKKKCIDTIIHNQQGIQLTTGTRQSKEGNKVTNKSTNLTRTVKCFIPAKSIPELYEFSNKGQAYQASTSLIY